MEFCPKARGKNGILSQKQGVKINFWPNNQGVKNRLFDFRFFSKAKPEIFFVFLLSLLVIFTVIVSVKTNWQGAVEGVE